MNSGRFSWKESIGEQTQLLSITSCSEMVSSHPKLLSVPRQLLLSSMMESVISDKTEHVQKAAVIKSYWKQPVERNVQRPSWWRRSVTDRGGTSMRQKDCVVARIAWMIAARITAGCVTATL